MGFFTSVSGASEVATGYTSVALYCANEGVGDNETSFRQLWPFTIPASAAWQIGNNESTFAVGGIDSLGGLLVQWDEYCGGTVDSLSSSTSAPTFSLSP
jgi:hypothetical protein